MVTGGWNIRWFWKTVAITQNRLCRTQICRPCRETETTTRGLPIKYRVPSSASPRRLIKRSAWRPKKKKKKCASSRGGRRRSYLNELSGIPLHSDTYMTSAGGQRFRVEEEYATTASAATMSLRLRCGGDGEWSSGRGAHKTRRVDCPSSGGDVVPLSSIWLQKQWIERNDYTAGVTVVVVIATRRRAAKSVRPSHGALRHHTAGPWRQPIVLKLFYNDCRTRHDGRSDGNTLNALCSFCRCHALAF